MHTLYLKSFEVDGNAIQKLTKQKFIHSYFQIMWVGMTTNERINQAKYMYLEAMGLRDKDKGHGHSHGEGPDCHEDHSKHKYSNPFQ